MTIMSVWSAVTETKLCLRVITVCFPLSQWALESSKTDFEVLRNVTLHLLSLVGTEELLPVTDTSLSSEAGLKSPFLAPWQSDKNHKCSTYNYGPKFFICSLLLSEFRFRRVWHCSL